MTSISVVPLSVLDETAFKVFLASSLQGFVNSRVTSSANDLIEPFAFYETGEIWVAKSDRDIVGAITLKSLNKKSGLVKRCLLKTELRSYSAGVMHALLDAITIQAQRFDLRDIWVPEDSLLVHSFSDILDEDRFDRVSNISAVPRELATLFPRGKHFVKKLRFDSNARRKPSPLS